MDIDLGESFKWFKVNPGYYGLYRVNYNESMVRKIKEENIDHWTIPDKCGTARDLFALANADYSEFSLALEFAKILEGETEFLLWDCVDGSLRKIGKLLRKSNPAMYESYKVSHKQTSSLNFIHVYVYEVKFQFVFFNVEIHANIAESHLWKSSMEGNGRRRYHE